MLSNVMSTLSVPSPVRVLGTLKSHAGLHDSRRSSKLSMSTSRNWRSSTGVSGSAGSPERSAMHAHDKCDLNFLLGAIQLDLVFDLYTGRAIARDELLAAGLGHWPISSTPAMPAQCRSWVSPRGATRATHGCTPKVSDSFRAGADSCDEFRLGNSLGRDIFQHFHKALRHQAPRPLQQHRHGTGRLISAKEQHRCIYSANCFLARLNNFNTVRCPTDTASPAMPFAPPENVRRHPG